MEGIADRAHEGRADAHAGQVHDQEQQGAGHDALIGPHFFLHQRHRRGQIEEVEEERADQEEQRQLPGGRPDEADEERNGQRQRYGRNQGIGLFRTPREAVDHPAGDEDAGAHADADDQCGIDGDFLQRHALSRASERAS